MTAEEPEGWEFPDGSALMLKPEPRAEPAPDCPQVTAEALRAWRQREGITVAAAAERTSVATNTWNRRERGRFDRAAPPGSCSPSCSAAAASPAAHRPGEADRPAREGRRTAPRRLLPDP